MRSLLFLALCAALGLVVNTSCCAQNGVLLSDNFDNGAVGQSIKDKPLDWMLLGPSSAGGEIGDVRLGSGEHGWTGQYIKGDTAAAVNSENFFLKRFPSVSNEWVKLSCKVYAAGSTSDDCTIGLCSQAWNSGRSMWISTTNGWQLLVAGVKDGKPDYTGETFLGGHDTTAITAL